VAGVALKPGTACHGGRLTVDVVEQMPRYFPSDPKYIVSTAAFMLPLA